MFQPATEPDPQQPVYCRHCGWTGIVQEAVVEPYDLVRCPRCTQAVDKLQVMNR